MFVMQWEELRNVNKNLSFYNTIKELRKVFVVKLPVHEIYNQALEKLKTSAQLKAIDHTGSTSKQTDMVLIKASATYAATKTKFII